ncbi:TerD family protein, partial [Intestinibacter sp.]|uniref:TerD family protein n=1 Tax=Intestinibacter sp. TaxID=1965304 RepID=UPI003F1757A6
KVFIDKNLKDYIAPLKMRDASKTLMPLERGSRINIENNKIRLFLHWLDGRLHTDLDLSIILYDEDFERIDNVSYFNMKIDGCVHSGDVRSAPAPEGGTEYIDIDLEKINPSCYYICVVVNAYTHEKFYELPECFVGYMDIDENLNTAYNPSFVKFKGDLTTETTVSLPYIVDVMANQIVWCDIDYDNLYPINNIQSRKNTTNMIVQNILNSRKPTMDKLVKLNVASRGELVENICEADLIFTDRKNELLDTDDIIRTREVDVVKTRAVFDEDGNEVGVEEYIEKDIEIYEARIVTPFDTDIISSELL